MGRLIDADAFKKRIGTETKIRKMMCMAIDEQPTAYDVEKIVEELETLPNREADYYYASSNDVIDREDAIDIVKRGGVE